MYLAFSFSTSNAPRFGGAAFKGRARRGRWSLFSGSIHEALPSIARLTIRRRSLARVLEKRPAEVGRTRNTELMTHLLDRERGVVQESLGLPDLQLIEVRHDAAAEGIAEEFFGPCRTRPQFAGDLADAQTVSHASQQQATDLLGGIKIGALRCRLATQSFLDLIRIPTISCVFGCSFWRRRT